MQVILFIDATPRGSLNATVMSATVLTAAAMSEVALTATAMRDCIGRKRVSSSVVQTWQHRWRRMWSRSIGGWDIKVSK